jgi:hypothetical protein
MKQIKNLFKRDFTWLGWRHNIHNRHNLFTKLSLQ